MLGGGIVAGAAVCFALLARDLTAALTVGIYVFYAAGIGCAMGNSMTSGLRRLPPEWNADGNAVINTLQQLAGAIGTAVVSSTVAAAQARPGAALAEATMSGTQSAFWLLAALAVAALVCSAGAFYAARPHRAA